MLDEFVIPKVAIIITTYEKVNGKYVAVVTHQFHGNTKEEAFSILNAHRLYDNFFKSSLFGVFITRQGTKIELKNSDIKVVYNKQVI